MLEICSSDTHSSSGKRTRLGYYALGNVTNYEKLLEPSKISQEAVSVHHLQDSHFGFIFANKINGKEIN